MKRQEGKEILYKKSAFPYNAIEISFIVWIMYKYYK